MFLEITSIPDFYKLDPNHGKFQGNWRHEVTYSCINKHAKIRANMYPF